MNEPDKQRRSGTVEVLERGAGNEPIVRERRRKKKEKKENRNVQLTQHQHFSWLKRAAIIGAIAKNRGV